MEVIMKLTHLKNDSFDDVINTNDVVLIDFYTIWCGPCQMLGPVMEEVNDMNLEGVQLYKVDVDEESELAAKFHISSIPTIVLIKNKKVVVKELGYRPLEEILKMIETAKL